MEAPTEPTRIVIVAGVTGSGKTTVGRALAGHLGWRFCDADDLHSAENVARMQRGLPLDDAMRAPWLDAIRRVMERALDQGERMVVACSALKAQYRARLADGLPGVRFVFLTAPEAVLYDRVAHREGHFAGPALLESQLETLELPEDAFTVDARAGVAQIVETICRRLDLRP